MQKLENLSSNIPKIIIEVLKNQNLCKYLYYNDSKPLSQPNLNLPATNLIFNKVYPYPFDDKFTTEEGSYLRIYYGNGRFNNKYVEDHNLLFDIVCSKTENIWLLNGADIRPYKIMEELINQLFNKDIDLGGKVVFSNFSHIFFNDSFNGVRLFSKITNISTGKK